MMILSLFSLVQNTSGGGSPLASHTNLQSYHINDVTVDVGIEKQAENGLQSRSSENGMTALWPYGLKLQ